MPINNKQFKRVLWRDGDVISREHFVALEEWVEQLIGLSNWTNSLSGLFREHNERSAYNNITNISFSHIDSQRYRVDIENMYGITPTGRIINIDGKRSFEFIFRPIQRSTDEKYYLYILPSKNYDRKKTEESEPVTGLVLSDSNYELSITNEQNLGLLICRFKVQDTTNLTVDTTFVPFGLNIDSSPMSLAARDNILNKFSIWDSLINKYLKEKLVPNANYNLTIPSYNMLWTLTGQFIRSFALLKPILDDRKKPTITFFEEIQRFFNAISTDILTFSIGWESETERRKANDVLNQLHYSIVVPFEGLIDIAASFNRIDENLNALLDFLACLPGGPIAEKTLPISKVEMVKETIGNRFNIYLEGESHLEKGKTKIIISLREFSKNEPIVKNIRVGVGNAIFAQLLDLKNLLKRIPGKVFSYTIDCPPEIITQEGISQLTLYLPPPMGEGIIDLKSHITIIIRD